MWNTYVNVCIYSFLGLKGIRFKLQGIGDSWFGIRNTLKVTYSLKIILKYRLLSSFLLYLLPCKVRTPIILWISIMYFQRSPLYIVIISWKRRISLQSIRKTHFCHFFCFVAVESLQDFKKICLRDPFHYILFLYPHLFCYCLKNTSLTSETDVGGQVLWCDTSLLISQGGPKRQSGFLTRAPSASAAVQVDLCLSPTST